MPVSTRRPAWRPRSPAIGRCHTGGRGPSPSRQGSGNGLLGGPQGGLPEPELLAAKLAVNVKPELYNDLVAMAAAAAAKVQTDPKLKLYWEKVHHALAP